MQPPESVCPMYLQLQLQLSNNINSGGNTDIPKIYCDVKGKNNDLFLPFFVFKDICHWSPG